MSPTANRSFDDTEHENCYRATDQRRADPVHRRGHFVARRCDGAGENEHHDARRSECPEDRLPREELQKHSAAEKADHGPGTADACPYSDGLIAFGFRIGSSQLVAAAFHALIPPAPTPPAEGSLRDRLIALVQAQAEVIAEAPVTLTAMSWLTLGGDLERLPGAPHRSSRDSPEVQTLRERVAEQYAAPFEAILSSPQAVAELGDVDRTKAAALLLGPIALGKLSTLPDFDYREIAVSAVDGFLATHRKSTGLSATSSE
jgi:hypothetical protein